MGDRNSPNILVAGYLVLKMRNKEIYDATSVLTATASIDIRLSDVIAGEGPFSQASVFDYPGGIRKIYIGTEVDPWRDMR